MTKEKQIEQDLVDKLVGLKYTLRSDIKDRHSLERNFREKFETLNRVRLTDSEFLRLREEIIKPDVFVASKFLRERQLFQREDGTPLYYTLVNIKEWCKNEFEVINQLRINTCVQTLWQYFGFSFATRCGQSSDCFILWREERQCPRNLVGRSGSGSH